MCRPLHRPPRTLGSRIEKHSVGASPEWLARIVGRVRDENADPSRRCADPRNRDGGQDFCSGTGHLKRPAALPRKIRCALSEAPGWCRGDGENLAPTGGPDLPGKTRYGDVGGNSSLKRSPPPLERVVEALQPRPEHRDRVERHGHIRQRHTPGRQLRVMGRRKGVEIAEIFPAPRRCPGCHGRASPVVLLELGGGTSLVRISHVSTTRYLPLPSSLTCDQTR